MLARGEGPIGRGQCPLCHKFFPEQLAYRGPSMISGPTNAHGGNPAENDSNKNDIVLELSIEARSHQRIKEERYKIAMNRHAKGERNSGGIIPHAKTGGEYIIESLYCPNCYVVDGYGLKGTNHTVSPMAIINRPPIGLSDLEIIAVIAYEQSRETPGDYSKVTVLKDWENYFGKKLTLQVNAQLFDTPGELVQKMNCFSCHKIPGISIANTGVIGPLLIMKTNAENRLHSTEYQKVVKEGKAHATTPKEYVIESIIDPGAFIVPGFADDMFKDYRHKFSVNTLDRFADFLLTQGEAEAIREGLDRLPNEREGSLL